MYLNKPVVVSELIVDTRPLTVNEKKQQNAKSLYNKYLLKVIDKAIAFYIEYCT